MYSGFNNAEHALSQMGARYVFTSFGEVYAGFEFEVADMPGYSVIVQNDHLREYNELSDSQRIAERLCQLGSIISQATIVKREPYGSFIKPKHKDNGVWFDDSIRKEMFIFGAGASANCITGESRTEFLSSPFRPPLGNDLFARRFKDIQREYDGVKQSIADLQQGNVEEFLEEEWRSVAAGNTVVMSRHMNIQYYLQNILRQVSDFVCEEHFDANLYSMLLRKLQLLNGENPKRRFGFVSFNQDTILEHFIELHFRTKVLVMEDYIDVNSKPFAVFKPHGSWNWGWKYPREYANVSAQLFTKNVNFYQLYFQLLGTPAQMIDWNSYGVERLNHDHGIGKFTIDKSLLQIIKGGNTNQYYPGLLLPYRDKDEFTFPLKHYHCLSSYLGYVETLYIVGWKGNERAFVKLLQDKTHHLKRVVIADPDPGLVESNLSKIKDRRDISIEYYSGFEDFVKNFLSSVRQ